MKQTPIHIQHKINTCRIWDIDCNNHNMTKLKIINFIYFIFLSHFHFYLLAKVWYHTKNEYSYFILFLYYLLLSFIIYTIIISSKPNKLLLLQLKTQNVKLTKKPYIKINTRELNRVFSTKYLSYILAS